MLMSSPLSPVRTNIMNGEPLLRTVKVINSQGLHMRPITAFVELASKFQSNVLVSKDGQSKINGKSPLGLLGLAAEQGTELTLEVNGPDAQEALEALVQYVAVQLPSIEP